MSGLSPTEELKTEVCVPPHFDAEVVGSIRALVHHDHLKPESADLAVERHLRGAFTRVYEAADLRAAWQMRDDMSFADAWYVALARRLDVTWITADQKAARTARRLGVTVTVV